MNLNLFGLIAGLVIFESVGQFLIKEYHTQYNDKSKNKIWMILVAMFCYLTIVFLLTKSYDYENIGFVNAIWSGSALVTVALVGRLFFSESFNKYEYIALGLILTGTVMLGFQGNGKELK